MYNEAEVIEQEFDGVYCAADLKETVINAVRNTFENSWQLKTLLCGLEKVDY